MPGFLTGLIPASHTPFDRGGGLDLSVVPRQARVYSGRREWTACSSPGTTEANGRL